MGDNDEPPRRQPPRRGQTQADRDLASGIERRERERLERLAAPHEVPHEVTGQYEGEELREARSRRSTGARLDRLEDKHDALVTVVGQLGLEVGRVVGQLETLPEHIKTISNFAERTAAREDAVAADGFDAKRVNRRLWAKIVSGVFGGGVLGAVLHHFLGAR